MLEEFLETDEFEKLQELPEGEDDRVTLPLPDNQREKVRELLIGRELIQLFDIIVHGDKVSQGCKVLNDEVKLLEEFLETDGFEELQDAADSIRSDTESGRKV